MNRRRIIKESCNQSHPPKHPRDDGDQAPSAERIMNYPWILLIEEGPLFGLQPLVPVLIFY